MKLTLPRFDSKGVLVVGDIMLDRYWKGPTARISPEAPVPVVNIDHTEERPGGAGNVALNLASLGCPAWLIGATGNDEAGTVLKTRLEAAGVVCSFITRSQQPTITKLRILSQQQQLIRLDFENAFNINADVIENHTNLLMDKAGAVLLSDYGKGVLSNPNLLIKAARAKGLPVVVDPKGTDFSRYYGATLLTPNLQEFEAVVGPCTNETELVQKGQILRSDLGLDALLVTRSENGMTLLREGYPELHLPTHAKEVFDVTGAGDTVAATLAAALAAGEELSQAAALANIAAGIVVGKLGTATVSLPELRRGMKKLQGGNTRGVISREQLLIAVEEAHAQGEKIVFTNGCFDLLHPGHVGYLAQAKRQGDRLIVAVNDDASVQRLKGEGRPINSIERRMAVLAGLQAVDWVVPFSEDTPIELLSEIRPDILLKGGDYSVDEVVGHEFVESYGGKVMVLEFLDDCSTTALVDKMKKSCVS